MVPYYQIFAVITILKYLNKHKYDVVFKFLSLSCCVYFPVDALPSIGRLLKSFCPKSPITPHSKMLLSTAACSSQSTASSAEFYLQPLPPGMSPCPSPMPFFQQLYHAVAYMEQELGDSPSHVCNSPHPGSSQHDSRPCTASSYLDSPIHLASASKHGPECSTAQVSVPSSCERSDSPLVTLVPSPHHTDLDDISQPDVGGVGDHLSGAEQGSLSESDSDASVKKEGSHEAEGEPLETPYIHHGEVEEFGSVIISVTYIIILQC